MSNIDQVSVCVEVACKLVAVLDDVLEDGKVNVADVTSIFPLLNVMKKLAELNVAGITAELKDLDNAEVDVIKALVKKEFDLNNDVLESKIEAVIMVALEFVKNSKGLMLAVKSLKE